MGRGCGRLVNFVFPPTPPARLYCVFCYIVSLSWDPSGTVDEAMAIAIKDKELGKQQLQGGTHSGETNNNRKLKGKDQNNQERLR